MKLAGFADNQTCLHINSFDVSAIHPGTDFWDEDDTRKVPEWEVSESRSIIFRWSTQPGVVQIRHEDSELWQSLKPIVEYLESYHKGRAVRVFLADLPPGATIAPHMDGGDELVNLVNRNSMAIVTNPDVEYLIDGIRHRFDPGECYEINNLMLHEVRNNGSTQRIHLLVDVLPHDWINPTASI